MDDSTFLMAMLKILVSKVEALLIQMIQVHRQSDDLVYLDHSQLH